MSSHSFKNFRFRNLGTRLFLSLFAVALFSFAAKATEVKSEEKSEEKTAEKAQEKQISRGNGYFLALETGELYYSSTDRENFHDGWVTGIRGGYDFLNYFGVEALFRFSGHNSSDATPDPGIPQSYFVYQTAALLKLQYPVMKRVRVGFGGGGGIFYTSPNQKANEGTAFRLMWMGQLGAEYFLRIKGLSIGIDPSFEIVQDMLGAIYQVTGFVRYTF